MSGQLGALLGADALGALDGQVATQAPEERRQDEPERDGGDHDRQDHVARLAEDAVRVQEQQRSAEHEGDAEPTPVEVGDPASGNGGFGGFLGRPSLG